MIKNKKEVIDLGSYLCSVLPIRRKEMAKWLSRYLGIKESTTYLYILQMVYEIEDRERYNNYKINKSNLWMGNKRFSKYEEDIIEILKWLTETGRIKEYEIASFIAPYMGRTAASIYSRIRRHRRESAIVS